MHSNEEKAGEEKKQKELMLRMKAGAFEFDIVPKDYC